MLTECHLEQEEELDMEDALDLGEEEGEVKQEEEEAEEESVYDDNFEEFDYEEPAEIPQQSMSSLAGTKLIM